jgi:hypothetical protein
MKNITVSVDDETYRRARVHAAHAGVSVSAMVKAFLVSVTRGETEAERLKREEARLREAIQMFSAGDRLSRGAVHERGA